MHIGPRIARRRSGGREQCSAARGAQRLIFARGVWGSNWRLQPVLAVEAGLGATCRASPRSKECLICYFTLIHARGGFHAPPELDNVRDCTRLGDIEQAPGSLAMGLQETIRRTCAPIYDPLSATQRPVAHPSPPTRLEAFYTRAGTRGVSVCSSGSHGAGALRRGRPRIGAAPAVAAAATRLAGRPASHSPVRGKGGV